MKIHRVSQHEDKRPDNTIQIGDHCHLELSEGSLIATTLKDIIRVEDPNGRKLETWAAVFELN